MSEGTENTHNVHIRKKRLLDSLNEYPELNKYGLNQQEASNEPAFVLVSFDENQFKKGNESMKVLDLRTNQEMHMNSYYENDFSHEQQSNVATNEENKIQNLNEKFCIEKNEENPNKGMQLCQKYRRLNEMSQEVLRAIAEQKEKLTQLYMNGQHHFGNPEMQLTNFLKSQINAINDENKIKNTMIGNTNNIASVDNTRKLETIQNLASYLNENFQMISCNGRNESCQEVQADNAMQLTNSLNSEINATTEANDIAIEGMQNMMITDTESFASFFQMISNNANDNESHPEVRINMDESELEKFEKYVEHLENERRIKTENVMRMIQATMQLLSFAEELGAQEQLEEEQNSVVQEREDKKDFKMSYTNDNKYDIPQAHNQNECLRQSPEYQEQHKPDNTHYNDLNNFELQHNERKNLPHCPISPEEQINIMKKLLETPKIQLEKPETENISNSSTSSAEYTPQMQIENKFEANENGMVCIGPNGTMIPRRTLESIDWSMTGAAVTRKLLVEIFGRAALAVSNLSGKPSPAFVDCNKPVKSQLNPIIIADLIHLMGERKGLTSKEVRNAITTKCADENKMLRLKEKKRQSIAARNMNCGPYF